MSAERRLEFVDTNVLVYGHDRSAADKVDRARRLIDRLWEDGTGALSIQVLQEFFVVVTRKLARPVDPDAAQSAIEDLGRWKVHSPVVADVLVATGISRRHRISFWDAMIVRSAQQLGCSTLWSEDLTEKRRYEGVQVRNPFTT